MLLFRHRSRRFTLTGCDRPSYRRDYELFRRFYGLRWFTRVKGSSSRGVDPPYGAVVGVLQTVLQMLENNAIYLGVATDHVIESFRNRLWVLGWKLTAAV